MPGARWKGIHEASRYAARRRGRGGDRAFRAGRDGRRPSGDRPDHPARLRPRPGAAHDGRLPGQHRDLVLRPDAAADRLRPQAALREGPDRQGQDDRHRRFVRLADDRAGRAPVRQRLRPARPAVAEGHPAGGRGAAVRRHQRRHVGLGVRDDARRRVRPRDRAGREHPARRDARVRDRGRDGLPRDRQGRELRHRPQPGRRDHPELRRDRGDVPEQGRDLRPALGVPERPAARGHRARRLGRQREHRLQAQPHRPLPAPGQLVAVVGPARHIGGRHAAAPRRGRQPAGARQRVE